MRRGPVAISLGLGKPGLTCDEISDFYDDVCEKVFSKNINSSNDDDGNNEEESKTNDSIVHSDSN